MKFLNILCKKIIILSIIAIINFSYSNETFNFQCVIETLTNSGCHAISTASIISDKYLVTSASSVDSDGLQDLLVICCDQNSFLIKAKPNKTIIIHPNYQPDEGLNNVALIKVPKKRLKSDCIKPIALPCNIGNQYFGGNAALTSTWITNTMDEMPETTVVQPEFPYSGMCYKYLYILYKYPYNQQNMCITLKNYNDTNCSPSHPIVIRNCQNESILAGITVFSVGCSSHIAGVKLSLFYEWIQNATHNKIPECKSFGCEM